MGDSFKPHRPRPIHFAERWAPGAWKIKVYYLYEDESLWDLRYIEIAKALATKSIQQQANGDAHHHAGFLTIHVARMFNQIIFDWWARENELRHIVFKANAETPTQFTDITSSGEAFCVWELEVIAFEREAWITHVLKQHTNPDTEGYFSTYHNMK